MQEPEVGVLPEILQRLLDREGMSGAELARRIGVHKSSVSLILSGKHHSTSVATAAKMAQVFNVSMDYLVGLSASPEPAKLNLSELLLELATVAKGLSSRRQRDLLVVARAYLEDSERARNDPDRLMEDVLSLIQEYGGEVSREELLRYISMDDAPSAGDDSDDTPLLDEDTE